MLSRDTILISNVCVDVKVALSNGTSNVGDASNGVPTATKHVVCSSSFAELNFVW